MFPARSFDEYINGIRAVIPKVQPNATIFNPDEFAIALEQVAANKGPDDYQMDGADLNTVSCPTGTQDCTFAYVDPIQVQPYLRTERHAA